MSKLFDSKEIRKISINKMGVISCVIPRDFAREYGFDKSIHILIERKTEGLLLKKLEI